VLRLHPALAPVKAAILPLSKKLGEQAEMIYKQLQKKWQVEYDDAGSIGKRYRRWDEAGTPFCITVDFQTQEDGCVTIRMRDSMLQERIPVDQLNQWFEEKIDF